MEREAREKLQALEELLDSWKSVAVGYSGGVDSTFLAAVCARAVPSRAVLMHIETAFSATPELVSVERAAGSGQSAFGLPLIAVPLDPFSLESVVRNDENRCYYCKLAGFSAILAEARARGIEVVVDGSNADDAGDYRPGMRALEELGVRSPLLETGWHKDEERALLREWGIPVWDMPAGACLATRIPCGEPLTERKLAAVRACEDYLHEHGLHQVRARLIEGSLQVEASSEDLRVLASAGAPADASDGASVPHEKGAWHGESAPSEEGTWHGESAPSEEGAWRVALPEVMRAHLAGCVDGVVNPYVELYSKGSMNR